MRNAVEKLNRVIVELKERVDGDGKLVLPCSHITEMANVLDISKSDSRLCFLTLANLNVVTVAKTRLKVPTEASKDVWTVTLLLPDAEVIQKPSGFFDLVGNE